MEIERASSLARGLLEEALPQRWAHTQGVARRARELAGQLNVDADLLEVAAWLHDIGYSPSLVVTEFHPLDGARYLRDVVHETPELCALVAHHSGACYEAEERGLSRELAAEFGHGPDTSVARALTASDMTTSPEGEPVTVERRIAEILTRYEAGSMVHRAVSRSATDLVKMVRDLDV